jgi:ribosomal protection tetracycline resistance protein
MIGAQSNDYNCVSFIKPLIKMQIELQDIGKEQEFVNVLQTLNIEDPYLDVQYNDIDISISLMGKMQADILTTIIKERFDLTVKFSNPVIIHKESPSQIGIGVATYTEFSGIEIEVQPSKHGSGLSYESVISTSYLHKKYQKQAMRLLKEYSKNCLFGWGLTDTIIRIKDGRFNSAGSESLHFNIAVPIAFMRALKKSGVRLLEPIMKYRIVAPEQYKKSIINWISQKSTIFEIMENADYFTVIGKAPATTLLNAYTELLELTKGFGILSAEFIEYSLIKSSDQRNAQYNKNSVSPINETLFVINKMNGSVDLLGNKLAKKKRASKSKFRRPAIR